MNMPAAPGPHPLAATYLQHLQALAAELQLAMDAIAGNALLDFQASVARQEMVCALLAGVRTTIDRPANSPGPAYFPADPATQRRIDAAVRMVLHLNLQYVALLRHSARSNAQLASLCRSHTGQFEEARWSRLKRQTWSCEM